MTVWKRPVCEWSVSGLALCFLGLLFDVGVCALEALMLLEIR